MTFKTALLLRLNVLLPAICFSFLTITLALCFSVITSTCTIGAITFKTGGFDGARETIAFRL